MSSAREPTDAEQVARCQESRDAFAQLYRRHAPPLFAFLRALHRDEHAAADALQETFLRAYQALPRFDVTRPMRPWLLRIALNIALDALERAGRVESRDPAELPEPRSKELDPGLAASAGDALASLLRRVGDRLPARKLASFVLARGQGLTYEEIASIQGCSTATVKRDLSDALRELSGAAGELGLA